MHKIIVLLTFVFFIFSCKKTTDTIKNNDTEYSFNKKRTIVISVDNTTDNIPANIQFIEKSNQIVILNKSTNAIQFYDFKDKGKEVKKIVLQVEGPNGVGNIADFLVHTPDSIFVLDANVFKLNLVNRTGEVITTYNLYNKGANTQNAKPNPFPFTPLVLKDNKIYISSTPFTQENAKYYEREGCVIIVDLVNKNTTIKYRFPEICKKNIYPSMLINVFNRTYSPKHKKFIHSFSVDDHIQVTDYETNTAYLANSKNLPFVEPLKQEILDPSESNRIANRTSIFSSIHYDNFKDVFYRCALIRKPGIEPKSSVKQTRTFIILDTNFEKIGETETVPLDNSSLKPVFTKEGMWLLNLKSPEDFITYDLFELTKK